MQPDDAAWTAACEALGELADDETDWQRVEAAFKLALSESRKGLSRQAREVSDER
jgi:hypothetical protein